MDELKDNNVVVKETNKLKENMLKQDVLGN